MPYPEQLVAPMRQEAASIGCTELKTAAEVEAAMKQAGTSLFFINSVCGCAAGMARPGLKLALEHAEVKPDHLYTVFAGNDAEATAAVRSRFVGVPPSSPAFGLVQDGELVEMVQRLDIEGHSAQQVALKLVEAFHANCRKADG